MVVVTIDRSSTAGADVITYQEFFHLWIGKGSHLWNRNRGRCYLARYDWHGARCYMLAGEKWARYNLRWDEGRLVLFCRGKTVTVLRGSTEELVEARLRGFI